MTGAGEGSRRGLGTRGKGSLVVPGARSKAGLLWGTERLRGLSERWKAPSSHPLREKPAEETSTVEEASPRLASVSALAQPLPGYPARPRAGRGDGQPRRNPAPSGFFFFAPAARSRPLRGLHRVISAEAAAATGRAGRGQGQVS